MSQYGLTWLPPEAFALISKSLAPDFLFISSDDFISSNAKHRFEKRTIKFLVSVHAPLDLFTRIHEKPVQSALPEVEELNKLLPQIFESINRAAQDGADAIVVLDNISSVDGPIVSPMHVVESLMPMYEKLLAHIKELGLPAIFSSQGDIHEYYSGLKSAGFDAVHIAHESEEELLTMLEHAREHKLGIYGGIPSRILDDTELSHCIERLKELSEEYPELSICDTGCLETYKQAEQAVHILQELK